MSWASAEAQYYDYDRWASHDNCGCDCEECEENPCQCDDCTARGEDDDD